ncbi:MAG TPA: hypothetical protein DHW02_13740 [Ktedonobacter sp.]|nr:hypothetical protein [Ktedonobacter sp.]
MQDMAVIEPDMGEIPLHKFILLVEDNEIFANLLIEIIMQYTSWQVEHVVDGQSALNVVEHIQPDLLILDYHLPDINGLELYERIHTLYDRSVYTAIPTIFASCDFPETALMHMKTLRLDKPFSIQQFLNAVQMMLDCDGMIDDRSVMMEMKEFMGNM